MRQLQSIRIYPNGLSGFVVCWQRAFDDDDEFKIVQTKEQLMRLLDVLLTEDAQEGPPLVPDTKEALC